MAQKKEYKIMYFPVTARGELCRLMLALSGQDFEDERVKMEDWPKLKPNTPFGGLPNLSVKGKGTVCQSGSISRFLAKKFGFYGSNDWEAVLCDEVVECVNDVITEWAKFHFEKDETKKAELKKKYMEESMPKFMAYIRKHQKEDGKNGFIIGSKMSIADVAVFNIIDQAKDRDNKCFDSQEDMMKIYTTVKSNPKLKKYLDTRPKSMF